MNNTQFANLQYINRKKSLKDTNIRRQLEKSLVNMYTNVIPASNTSRHKYKSKRTVLHRHYYLKNNTTEHKRTTFKKMGKDQTTQKAKPIMLSQSHAPLLHLRISTTQQSPSLFLSRSNTSIKNN